MPTPTPSQILEQIRSHYLTRLRQGMADHASEGILTVVSEAAVRGRDGKLLRRGNPATPVRVDLITLVNDQVRDGMEIESETMPGFPAFSLKWRDVMPVKVWPFPWNACAVRMTEAGMDMKRIVEWFEKWFDVDEAVMPGEDGLLGVVHSISSPPTAAASGVVQLMVDFGSAPVEAFEDMIEAIHVAGARSVEIGVAP